MIMWDTLKARSRAGDDWERAVALQKARSKIGYGMAQTMTAPGLWRYWEWRKRLRWGQSRDGRCCSSGTPAKKKDCLGRAISPTTRQCLWTNWWRRSTLI